MGSSETGRREEVFELEKKVPKVSRRSRGAGKNLRLVERDFEVLRFILEMKSCCSDQIWERFYRLDAIGIKYVQNRLSRLRRGEYLLSHYTHDGPVRYYTATRKAKEVVMDFFGLDEFEVADGRSSVELAQFSHDKGLVWIRIFLENMGVVEPWVWDSEVTYKHRELAGRKMKDVNLGPVADGVIKIEGEGGLSLAAIEFENSIKSRKRRLEKVRALWGGDQVVWPYKVFVFANKKVERAYRETFSEFFLERAKKFDFEVESGYGYDRFESCWEREVFIFGRQRLLCVTYEELVELYKVRDGADMGAMEVFRKEEVFEESRRILREGNDKRNLKIEQDQLDRQKQEEAVFEQLARKDKKSKGFLEGLFGL